MQRKQKTLRTYHWAAQQPTPSAVLSPEDLPTVMNGRKRRTHSRVVAVRQLLVGVLTASAICGLAWTLHSKSEAANLKPHGAYTTAGYGGYSGREPEHKMDAASSDPVQPIRDAYNAGHYGQVEWLAARLAQAKNGGTDAQTRKQVLQAMMLAAYSAARQNNFTTARTHFGGIRRGAEALPDKGKPTPVPGQVLPTLEEEAAFQYAVCTGKIDGPNAAEREYRNFLTSEPQSVLIHAAIRRIARLHNGNIPKDAEHLWKQAMTIQRDDERKQRREASLCGPEVVSELLRRKGKSADVHALADAMHTNENGTSLSGMADGAKRYGLRLRGLMLKPEALAAQKRPLVALVAPGHFVLVENVTPQAVTVWNPDKNGIGKAGTETLSAAEWGKQWDGAALTTGL